MNIIAVLMVVSLLATVITSIDPRVAGISHLKTEIIRISIGIILGFALLFLYGLGIPGLKYFFFVIGIGGFIHLFFSQSDNRSSQGNTAVYEL